MNNRFPCYKTNVCLQKSGRTLVTGKNNGLEYGEKEEVRCDVIVYSIYENRRYCPTNKEATLLPQIQFVLYYEYLKRMAEANLKNWDRSFELMDNYEIEVEIADFIKRMKAEKPELIVLIQAGYLNRLVMV